LVTNIIPDQDHTRYLKREFDGEMDERNSKSIARAFIQKDILELDVMGDKEISRRGRAGRSEPHSLLRNQLHA